MQSINFDDGYKSYEINGDKNRVLRVNMTDFAIVGRMRAALETFERLKPDATPEGLSEADRIARDQIDNVFGAGASDIIFGRTNLLSLANGQPVCANFLEAVAPIIKADIEAEGKKSSERIAKYKAVIE